MWLLLSAIALPGVPEPGARGTATRPTLSGPVSTLDSADGLFRVHYTLEGSDAVSVRDDDGSGVPDYVERIRDALVDGRDTYVADGWRGPVGDLGDGGSTALDVYLTGVDINGYAYPLDGQAAEGGYACFIEMDPALATAGLILESVAVHELHHCIEYRYGLTASWIHEGSATAEQYTLASDLGLLLAVNVLWDTRLSQPELALPDRTGRYEYAAFTFFKFWADDVAPRRAFWESIAAEGGEDWRAHAERAATDQGFVDFAEAFLDFEAELAFACALDDEQHWEDDGLRCTSQAIVPIEFLADGATALASSHTDAPYTATFHELPAGGSTDTLEVSCGGPDLGIALAAVDADGVATDELAATSGTIALTAPVAPDGAFRIVVASFAEEPRDIACSLTRLPPSVDTGEEPTGSCGCRTAPPVSLGWMALALLVRRRSR